MITITGAVTGSLGKRIAKEEDPTEAGAPSPTNHPGRPHGNSDLLGIYYDVSGIYSTTHIVRGSLQSQNRAFANVEWVKVMFIKVFACTKK